MDASIIQVTQPTINGVAVGAIHALVALGMVLTCKAINGRASPIVTS